MAREREKSELWNGERFRKFEERVKEARLSSEREKELGLLLEWVGYWWTGSVSALLG